MACTSPMDQCFAANRRPRSSVSIRNASLPLRSVFGEAQNCTHVDHASIEVSTASKGGIQQSDCCISPPGIISTATLSDAGALGESCMSASADAISTPAAAEEPPRMSLMLGALGIVFGDIGTSPIYAFRESLKSA